ncbi:hypothetical protein PILCRDRAFT_79670, partial [Piloderma croceum F 1598]
QTAKFSPWWDSPYEITDIHPKASTYTLNIHTNTYPIYTNPIYHTSKLKLYITNNPNLFLNQQLLQSSLIVTADNLEEYTADKIINS